MRAFEKSGVIAFLATLASLGNAQSTLCRTSTTISVPPVTRILQAASTCTSPGGALLPPKGPYTTIYQTTYLEFCPTGLQAKTYTITESCSEGQPTTRPTNYIPPGFTTTVTECHVCGNAPITATLTVPCSGKCAGANGGTAPTLGPHGDNEAGSSPDNGNNGAGSSSNNGKPQGGQSPGGTACTGDKCALGVSQGDGQPGSGSKPAPAPGNSASGGQSPGGAGGSQGEGQPGSGSKPAPSGNSDSSGGKAAPSGGSPGSNADPAGGAKGTAAATAQPGCTGGQCQGTTTSTGGSTRYTGAAVPSTSVDWLGLLFTALALLLSV